MGLHNHLKLLEVLLVALCAAQVWRRQYAHPGVELTIVDTGVHLKHNTHKDLTPFNLTSQADSWQASLWESRESKETVGLSVCEWASALPSPGRLLSWVAWRWAAGAGWYGRCRRPRGGKAAPGSQPPERRPPAVPPRSPPATAGCLLLQGPLYTAPEKHKNKQGCKHNMIFNITPMLFVMCTFQQEWKEIIFVENCIK